MSLLYPAPGSPSRIIGEEQQFSGTAAYDAPGNDFSKHDHITGYWRRAPSAFFETCRVSSYEGDTLRLSSRASPCVSEDL
jgi:hypothetical protein